MASGICGGNSNPKSRACSSMIQRRIGLVWSRQVGISFIGYQLWKSYYVLLREKECQHYCMSLFHHQIESGCFMVDEDLHRVLNRYNSWSRMDITIQAFSVLCDFAEITPFFLHFLVGMGRKFSSKDEDFMSCYSTFASENSHLVSTLGSGMEKDSDSLWGEFARIPASGKYSPMV